VVRGFLCNGLETTARVEASHAFRRMFEASPTPFLVLAPDAPRFTIVEVNDAYLTAVMRTREELLGLGVFEAMPDNPDDLGATGVANLRASLERALATRRPDAMPRQKYDIPHPSGGFEERWWDSINSPLLGKRGEVEALIHHVVDVTEQQRAEDRLRELNSTLEERVAERTAERNILAKLVEMTEVMVMAVDLDYNILALNAANADGFERIYGVRPKVGDNMLELLSDWPEHREEVRTGWARGMRGEHVTFVEEFGDPDRARPYYEVSFRPLWNEVGEQIGVYQFVTDVTDRLRKEAQLAEAQEALRQSQKMEAMGQLTGGIAHDFNNLLGAVVGSFDLIRRKPFEAERVKRWAENGMAAAERGAKLTGQLLAFARAQRLEKKPVVVADLVGGMRDLLERTLGPMVRLKLDLAGDGAALSDPTQLEMAVLNLAINARDAMPDGGELRVATVSRRLEKDPELGPGEYVEVAVTDSGTGMPPEIVARAFDPFFTTKGVGKGTGLGLSQVYGVARQTGGTARIDSRPGEGTTVRILLPRTTAPAQSEPGGSHEANARAKTTATVLVVDDDPDIRRVLVDLLEALGYGVIEASDGPSGLAELERRAPDVMMVDFAMPSMNGAEVAKAAREKWPDLPIVFASGYSDTAAIESAVGADAIMLRKPFRVDDLQAILAATLAERR
jgi:PAS domain S-box-containing protein